MPDFSTKVDAWVKKTKERQLAVFRESTQRLVSLMQSRIPVDSGFARASILASLTEMPKIDPSANKPTSGTKYPYNPISVTLVIAKAQIGDNIHIGWTANYVPALERGHSKQAPSGFIRVSALEWPRIVSEVTADARRRVESHA